MAVLDSEAISALANPKERGISARRAQAVLEAVERRGGTACVPAPVLAEVSRTPARSAAVGRIVRHVQVVPTDRHIAEEAGRLLELDFGEPRLPPPGLLQNESSMIAACDETTPEGPDGIFYVVTAAVILADRQKPRLRLKAFCRRAVTVHFTGTVRAQPLEPPCSRPSTNSAS